MLLPTLKKEGSTLGDLISSLKQPAETQELRFEILAGNVRDYGEQVIRDLSGFVGSQRGMKVDPENYEGIRVNVYDEYSSGWFLLRMSLHEPLLVLQVENDQAGMNQKVLEKLASFFEAYRQLGLEQLNKLLR